MLKNMNKEDKELLLQDLSARLSYGVICHTKKGDGHLCSINQTIFGTKYGINIKAIERDYFNDREEVIKPYLRPMSSMTEEEKNEFGIIACEGNIDYPYGIFFRCQDWLNKNMFDYRGLIEKGLAIAVVKDNNPYKE